MDNENVTIQVEDLRRAFSVLLAGIVANFGSTVTLCERTFEADHYWDLELGPAFRLVDHPELHIVAGQTSDDVEEVRDVVEREGGEVFLWHDLDHLAGVLRRSHSSTRPFREIPALSVRNIARSSEVSRIARYVRVETTVRVVPNDGDEDTSD